MPLYAELDLRLAGFEAHGNIACARRGLHDCGNPLREGLRGNEILAGQLHHDRALAPCGQGHQRGEARDLDCELDVRHPGADSGGEILDGAPDAPGARVLVHQGEGDAGEVASGLAKPPGAPALSDHRRDRHQVFPQVVHDDLLDLRDFFFGPGVRRLHLGLEVDGHSALVGLRQELQAEEVDGKHGEPEEHDRHHDDQCRAADGPPQGTLVVGVQCLDTVLDLLGDPVHGAVSRVQLDVREAHFQVDLAVLCRTLDDLGALLHAQEAHAQHGHQGESHDQGDHHGEGDRVGQVPHDDVREARDEHDREKDDYIGKG
jgi:hypothetical protein